MSNIAKARVTVRGTRVLLQHRMRPESIALEKQERTGVAGNDPEEWKRSRMVLPDGTLYIPGDYVFGCLRNGAKHVKKGLQTLLVSTLNVEDEIICLDRKMPPEDRIQVLDVKSPHDTETQVFVYVCPVRNPQTKGRNIRYRLAARAGWTCAFTISWDKTIVAREVMKSVVIDAGRLGGLADGINNGCGRYEVVSFELLEGDNSSGEAAQAAKRGRAKTTA
jgi:hypothetical protein